MHLINFHLHLTKIYLLKKLWVLLNKYLLSHYLSQHSSCVQTRKFSMARKIYINILKQTVVSSFPAWSSFQSFLLRFQDILQTSAYFKSWLWGLCKLSQLGAWQQRHWWGNLQLPCMCSYSVKGRLLPPLQSHRIRIEKTLFNAKTKPENCKTSISLLNEKQNRVAHSLLNIKGTISKLSKSHG